MIATAIKISLIVATCIITIPKCEKVEIRDETSVVLELEDVSTLVIKEALKSLKEIMELELISPEFQTVYNGLNEEQIIALKDVIHMVPMDYHYKFNPITVTGKNREILEALVYGEAGGEDFVGQCLVAQCIRDTMSRLKTTDVNKVIREFKYKGSTGMGTSQSCKDAVAFIFDNGGYVVKQRVIYFYSPDLAKTSKFHEEQDFIIEWGGHRFFDDSSWK